VKPVGSSVQCRIAPGRWAGERPVVGDVLRTARGRTYLVIAVAWPRLTLLVVPAELEHRGREHRLIWNARRRRK
jgi:hypothetical protein